MPYIFVTVQSGGWDPSLPINLDYSPELDPEIHSFLREQEQHQASHRDVPKKLEAKGTVATHCELRLILDGLEKLGFQLITTTAYSFQGRSHNEFIMHRELAPIMNDLHGLSKQTENKKNNNKDTQQDQRSSSNQSTGEINRRAPDPRVSSSRNRPVSPSGNRMGQHSQKHLYY